ncbi:SUMO-interacting motif-containing 1 [Schistosoma japonicum]|nr:SUMO-interacting motif-containing 1 [Schistosoma japonicum]
MIRSRSNRFTRKSIDDLTLVLIPEHGVLRLCPKVHLSEEGRNGKPFLSEKQKHHTLEGILETSKLSVNEVLKYEVKDNDFLLSSLGTRNYLIRPGLSARRFLVQWVRQLDEDEIARIFSETDVIQQRSLSSLSTSKYSSLLNYDHHLEETDFQLENVNRLKLHRSLSVPAEIWFIVSNEVSDKVKEDDSEDESVSPESFLESIVPPNSTQPTCPFIMEPQNTIYETSNILDELTDHVNTNELMEMSSQKQDQLIQPNGFHNNTLESDERNNLSTTIQDEENPLESVHYDEEINSRPMVDIQYSSDNIMNNIQTSLERDVSNPNTESFWSYNDNVFLSDAHDNDYCKRLEQDNDQLEVDVDRSESLGEKDYMLTDTTDKVSSNYIPNTRNYTIKSFEVNVSPPNVATSKLPVLSRTKTLPIIKRKSKFMNINYMIPILQCYGLQTNFFHFTDLNENIVASSTLNSEIDASDHDKHFKNHEYLDDDLQGLSEHEHNDVILNPITTNQRQSIIINLEPLIPLRETRSNSVMFETSIKKSIPLTFSKTESNWHNKAPHSDKDVQFAFVPISQSDLPVSSVNEKIKRLTESRFPLPELLTILLSGKPDLILKRIFGEIHPECNLAQELRNAIETIYRVLPKSHAFGSVANLIGMRPGYKLEVQILKPVKHSTVQQVISNQQNHDLEKLILQIAEVCSLITTELIGTNTLKHTKHFTGLNLETLIMNLVKGAIYETPLANRGVLSGLLAAAGGGIDALMGLLASVGAGVEGLSKLLATGANPPEALGELLRSLNDDPVKALKDLANAMGGGVDGIKNILNALGGDKQHALQELIKQVAAGGIKELIGSLFGEGSEGLAGLVAAVGGGLEGMKNLIQAAGGGVDGIKNLIALGGDEVTGLRNLLSAVGGDTVADALSTLIKAAGGIKDGLAALLQESGGGAKGLENLLEAVGGGVEGLKNLLKAIGDDPTEALDNILTGAGGGAEGLKNLLKAVGGGAEGLKNLLNIMGDNPDEALANILKAAGGGAEALKNLLECIGGGAEGLQTLLQSLGGDPAHALANFIASVGGVEEGGGIEGLKKLIATAGAGEEGLRNIIEAVGGGLDGLKTLLSSLGDEPVESLRSLLTNIDGGKSTSFICDLKCVADLIAAAGGGASGLKNLFDAVGGGVQGLTNLLSAFGGDMSEALLNLLNVTGDQKEDLKNLIGALGGSAEGLENLLKVIGDKVGIDGLLKTLGGGARGLATLLNSFEGDKEEAIRKLLEVSGGGVKGLAALLKSAGGGMEAITEIINAFGGGHEALAKLLASCGDNPADALRVLLEMLGGDENALRNLLLASGLDANDPNALKSLFEALGGADAGLGILVNAMGGGKDGMKKLLETFGNDGLAHLIVAAGGENGIEALIKAMGGQGVEGLTVLIDILGGKENGLATLIMAAGGGQAGLTALLKAAGKFAKDGDGLGALVAAAGGGAEGLEALINAAGGDGEGLNDILLAAGATDASSKANILKSLISSGGGGQEGLNNVLKILARGKNNKPIDGLANLLKVLGSNPDTLEIVLEAIGGNTYGLADILAAAGGGAEAMELLINVAGGGAEGLAKLLESAKVDNLQQLADILAAAGLSDDIVSAARSGNLSELSAKELCREEKEWLRTRPTGPISFCRKLTTTKRSYRKWKKSSKIASAAQQEFDLTVLPTFSQSTIESSMRNLYSYQQCSQDKLNKFASQLNSNILESLKAKIIHLDRKIDSDVKETDLFYENQFLEEERLLRQDDNQIIDPLNIQSFNEEEHQREEEMLLESKRLIEAFDEHVKMRKRLRDEEILTKYKNQDEIVIPEDIQHVIDNVNLHETECFEEPLTEVVEDKDIMDATLEELSKTTRMQSQFLIVHNLLRESIGLERNSKITPAFVWSYFELLKSMRHHLQSPVPLGQENDEQIHL